MQVGLDKAQRLLLGLHVTHGALEVQALEPRVGHPLGDLWPVLTLPGRDGGSNLLQRAAHVAGVEPHAGELRTDLDDPGRGRALRDGEQEPTEHVDGVGGPATHPVRAREHHRDIGRPLPRLRLTRRRELQDPLRQPHDLGERSPTEGAPNPIHAGEERGVLLPEIDAAEVVDLRCRLGAQPDRAQPGANLQGLTVGELRAVVEQLRAVRPPQEAPRLQTLPGVRGARGERPGGVDRIHRQLEPEQTQQAGVDAPTQRTGELEVPLDRQRLLDAGDRDQRGHRQLERARDGGQVPHFDGDQTIGRARTAAQPPVDRPLAGSVYASGELPRSPPMTRHRAREEARVEQNPPVLLGTVFLAGKFFLNFNNLPASFHRSPLKLPGPFPPCRALPRRAWRHAQLHLPEPRPRCDRPRPRGLEGWRPQGRRTIRRSADDPAAPPGHPDRGYRC